MIILQEIHQVMGEREFDFEETFRRGLLQSEFASDARSLWFAWASHGTGEGYEAFSATAFENLDAWNAFDESSRYGNLAEWSIELDSMRYYVDVSLNRVPEWSPSAQIELSGVDSRPSDHEPSQLRLDSVAFGPDADHEAQRVCEAAAGADDAVLELIACWSSMFGNADNGITHFLSRIRISDGLSRELKDQEPARRWSGSPSSLGGIPRSRVRSRFLRTVPWSPLG